MNVAGYVALTLYVGAAFAEANGDQRQLLKTKLPPMIQRMREEAHDDLQWRLAVQSLLMRVQQVMGADWRPRGEAWGYIERLLRDALQERQTKTMDVR